MTVREVMGSTGKLRHVVPTVWRADPQTICILLDNPGHDRWLIITLDVCDEPAGIAHPTSATEAA